MTKAKRKPFTAKRGEKALREKTEMEHLFKTMVMLCLLSVFLTFAIPWAYNEDLRRTNQDAQSLMNLVIDAQLRAVDDCYEKTGNLSAINDYVFHNGPYPRGC